MLDVNLLYGEMVGSWLAHMAFAVGIGMVFKSLRIPWDMWAILGYIGLCILASFFTQSLFLMILQSNSCSGMKNYFGVFAGAGIAAIITGIMIAIPVLFEPMRLVVSQLFGDHHILLTPQLSRVQDVVTTAAADVTNILEPPQTGGSLSKEKYDDQTLLEISYGSGFWGAFAGAYGIGIGSLFAGKCS